MAEMNMAVTNLVSALSSTCVPEIRPDKNGSKAAQSANWPPKLTAIVNTR
jgi:hypothetical protein